MLCVQPVLLKAYLLHTDFSKENYNAVSDLSYFTSPPFSCMSLMRSRFEIRGIVVPFILRGFSYAEYAKPQRDPAGRLTKL